MCGHIKEACLVHMPVKQAGLSGSRCVPGNPTLPKIAATLQGVQSAILLCLSGVKTYCKANIYIYILKALPETRLFYPN